MRPRATYRVQLHAAFGFDDVARFAPYLSALAITHVYCSPYFQAETGSTHGYDIVDHGHLNPELGGRDGFERMIAALDAHGLKHIVDVVPNHVSIATQANARWWDVLKRGRDSEFASWFDIDWDPPHAYLKNKVLVPILGDDLERCVERDEIRLARAGDEPVIVYLEHELPVTPGSLHHGRAMEEVDLGEVLARQHYVLANWRVARRHLNYRRFFDIATLAGLQMDGREVFEGTHRLLLELIATGRLDGVRIDHIDGLRDPKGYLETLRERSRSTYTVVEKILEGSERLPGTWPVEGTTGYDSLNVVLGVFVDASGEEPLTAFYQRFTGEATDLAAMVRAKKFLIMRHVLAAEMTRLVSELGRSFDSEGWAWDEDELRVAIAEVAASLDVYRTYVAPDGSASEDDHRILQDALAAARRRCTFLPARLFDRLQRIFTLAAGGPDAAGFLLRFQQTTGAIMAKSVEDTVFYNYNRFIALNEVGGDPGRFGVSIAEFHQHARRVQERWPQTMVATSTHDTKRSEDVRARLALISEIPSEWEAFVQRLSRVAEPHRTSGHPDRNAEYLLYQTLVGAWPLTEERAVAFMMKAAKEAKSHTSWTDPDPGYEAALETFVRGLMNDEACREELEGFARPLVAPGRINSLAQTLIKTTHPGYPDVYQGTEVWDLSLVDPDNRRPVDLDRRAELLAELRGAPDDPVGDDGRGKLFVTSVALRLRRELAHAFGPDGTYVPLAFSGSKAAHALGYIRAGDVAVVVPRLVLTRGLGWRDTKVALPEGEWKNVFTGASVPGGPVEVAAILESFPVALLVRS